MHILSRIRRHRSSKGWPAAVATAVLFAVACTPSAHAAGSSTSTVGYDTFSNRTTSTGWGSAITGGTYTTSPASSTFVKSGGVMRHTAASTRVTADLDGTDVRDGQVSATVSMSAPTTEYGQTVAVVMRRLSDGEDYEGRLRVISGGTAYLTIDRRSSSGVDTVISQQVTVPLTAAERAKVEAGTGSFGITLAVADVSPTNLEAKAWFSTDPTPSSWMVTTTDSTRPLAQYGAIGLDSYLSSGASKFPVDFRFSSLNATMTNVGSSKPASTVAYPTYGSSSSSAARFYVPANARYVSTSGSDAGAGSYEDPWRTLAHAISFTPANGTIVMRGGTYHESDQVYGKALTIENYPGETVWMSGSQRVTSWTAVGSIYRSNNWTYQFPQGGRPDLTNSSYPLAAYPDQVFIDGTSQTQVASQSAVKPGTFYVDYKDKELFIGSSPTGHDVEGSSLAQALVLNDADGSRVSGIGFERYANHPNVLGAVLDESNDASLLDDTFRQNASIGLSVLGTDTTVSHSNFTDNGQLGLHADSANGLVLSNNLFQHNDTEHFTITGAEGNLKVTNTVGVTVTHNISQYSVGRGMWFDVNCSNVVIADNVIFGNSDRGLQFETSQQGIIAGNIIANNALEGLSMFDDNHVQVFQNTFWHDTRAAYVLQDNRNDGNASSPLTVSNITIENNIIDDPRTNASQLLATEDVTRKRSSSSMALTFDYNAYADNSVKYWFGWANYPSSYEVFSSPSSFTGSTKQEAHSVFAKSSGELIFNNPAAGDFTRKSSSFVTGKKGVPLPAAVAQAMGVGSGSTLPLGSPLTSATS